MEYMLHDIYVVSIYIYIYIQTVEALKEIGRSLGKRDWDFSVDPCSGERGWKPTVQIEGSENAVTCNCTFRNGTLCHVVSM